MVRSVGIAAVVVGLAWTGLSFAQPSSPGSPSASASPARYITLREEGKPPQRCKLLKTWREPNGTPAFQVQAVDTGELMTIVGSAPAGASEPGARAMSTRIFHWGPGNKPPAGAPLPPSASAASKPAPAAPQVRVPNPPPPAQNTIVPYPAPAPVASQPSAPARPSTSSWATTTTTTTPVTATPTAQRKPAPALADSAPILSQPYPSTSTTEPRKPAIVFVTPQPSQDAKNVTVVTPPETKPATTPQTARTPQIVDSPTGTAQQPRLVPSAAGTVVSQGPCNSCCQPSCGPCCSSCNACCQSSCVCCPPSKPRQSWISLLFNSSSPCCPSTQTAVAVKPATPAPTPQTVAAKPKPVVKVATEPARPRDWRESWGKVEPWKETPKADASKPVDVPAKRVTQTAVQFDPAKQLARTPVKMDAPKQPGPLKDPAWFGDNALKRKLANSKIPDDKAAPLSRAIDQKIVVQNVPATPAVTAKPPLPPTRSPGQPVQLSADEPNAFWTAEKPPKQDERQPAPKFNAFDRDDSNPPPPQGGAPAMAGGPQGMMPMGAPAMGPMPMPMPPRPPMMPPMMPDTGVPSALANAFTLAGTRRPIPADFGGTPQEPNGFGNAEPFMDLQGGPPRPYAVPRGMMPPPYPGMQRPMAVNPLMSVPPTPVASNRSAVPSETTGGVPQLLATLKDSLYPSQRETAVEQLRELNWRMQPQVVEGLTKSARDDPAATVRAACVRALVYMKVNRPDVAALVQGLKNDRDARVRHEAEQALTALGVAPAVRQDSGFQQASHK